MTWTSPVNDDTPARLSAIEPGIPEYMRSHVAEWAGGALGGEYNTKHGVISMMSLQLKVAMPTHISLLERYLSDSTDGFLVTALDWLLYHDSDARSRSGILKIILDQGRSEWTVNAIGEGKPRMTRRIPEGVEAVLSNTVDRTGAAGSLLAEAFNSIYGAAPNPNHAYDMCVKAVETKVCPLFLPDNTRATLSSVYNHLSHKEVSLPLRETNMSDKDLIIAMMNKLFVGAERHGSESYEHVSLEGAKTALSLATALISMFHENVVTVS